MNYLITGTEKLRKKDYIEAIADFTAAIKNNPKEVDAYFKRGFAKSGLEDYDGAIADYTKAIEIDPMNVDAYFFRGEDKSTLEDHEGAIADYTKVIEIDPQNADAYCSRGSSKDSIDDFDGAVTDYTKAIEIEPDNGSYYYSRGLSKVGLNQIENAYQDFCKARDLGDSDASGAIKKYCSDLSNNEEKETGKKSGCFIATACYGSYEAEEVLVLRNFRDGKLQSTFFGKHLVAFYYFVSPFFAKMISNSTLLKKIVRNNFLKPIVSGLRKTNNSL